MDWPPPAEEERGPEDDRGEAEEEAEMVEEAEEEGFCNQESGRWASGR